MSEVEAAYECALSYVLSQGSSVCNLQAFVVTHDKCFCCFDDNVGESRTAVRLTTVFSCNFYCVMERSCIILEDKLF